MGKLFIYGGITVGGLIGAYLPVWLFHVDALSLWSILMSAVGSFIGLWIGYKANQNFGE
jgi:uncharacterized membrane protein YeaQ/YmgE (transglycosylase-associated protein family)